MIEVQGVSIKLGGLTVLQDVTTSIPTGGIVAIIGPNGAGKSTLLHCMAGLLTPDDGQILIDGKDVHAIGERERSLQLSFLSQSPATVPRLSVRDLVGFGRWPHHRGRPTAVDAELVEEAIDRFDLGGIAEKDVETLSGGQKQRAFVAMAYAQTTPWMFLDEPLAALDPKFSRDIMARLTDVTKNANESRSVALVLHDLQTALRCSDWVVCLKEGRIRSSGSTQDTLTSELLSDLYETPIEIGQFNDMPVVV